MNFRKQTMRGLMLLGVVAITISPAVQAGNCRQGKGKRAQCQGQGQATRNGQPGAACCGNLEAPGTLSEEETRGLTFMLQEERLAHEVYVWMYETWGHRIFDNISAAESRHMAALSGLVETYGVDVADADEAGIFANADLQALYNQLIEQGEESLAAALRAGALVEEVDIEDLLEQIDNTDNVGVKQVYENLLQASHRHLRAFVRQLDAQEVTYQPQHLDAETYQAILNGGNGNRGRNGKQTRTTPGQRTKPRLTPGARRPARETQT